MWVGKRNVYRVEHHRVSHFTPVGGNHIGRYRQSCRAAELRHDFTTRESLLRAARIFRVGQYIIQPFAQRNGFIQ